MTRAFRSLSGTRRLHLVSHMQRRDTSKEVDMSRTSLFCCAVPILSISLRELLAHGNRSRMSLAASAVARRDGSGMPDSAHSLLSMRTLLQAGNGFAASDFQASGRLKKPPAATVRSGTRRAARQTQPATETADTPATSQP